MAQMIATSALGNRIYLGNLNKTGDSFTGNKKDVTGMVMKAVIDHVGEGKTQVVTVDGVPDI